MSGLVGTEDQQRLQQRVVDAAEWLATTPGACNSGRLLGCDDIDRLGWDRIETILRRDGACSFRMVPTDRVEEVSRHLAGLGFRIDFWDLYVGDRSQARPVSARIAATGPPAGLADVTWSRAPSEADIAALQRLMMENGIAPFPAAALTGQLGPGTLVAVEDGTRRPVAVAFAYLPHNRHSPYHRHAFVGLVAVSLGERGRGLGRYVNALMVAQAFDILGADVVYEIVHTSNEPSQRIVTGCGLYRHPTLQCGIAVAGHAERFTR
jgi:RimJ/RimL family protein N-acetyltransferase